MLKFLENNLPDKLKNQQYASLKCELDEIYDKFIEGVRVQDRCQVKDYYEIKNLINFF